MTTPSDRIPEFSPHGESRYGREPAAANPDRPGRHLDDETREVVDTFEALYAAELSSSPAQPPAEGTAVDDDLLIDLPHEFDVPGRDAAKRMPGRSARDGALRDAGRARAPQRSSESAPELDIDDAYAVLQAAETKARADPARVAVDRDDDDVPVHTSLPVPAVRRERSRSGTAHTRAAPLDWAGRAREIWPRLAGAALIALVVGAGLGYLAGRSPEPAPHATIPVTPEGTAKLQFDYDLHPR